MNLEKRNKWNGVWINEKNYINANFFQVNDKLYMSFSTFSYDTVFYNGEEKDDNECPANLFTGIGYLNDSKTVFVLEKVLCSNYKNDLFDFVPYNFSGKLNDEGIIELYSNKGDGEISVKLKRVKGLGTDVYNIYKNGNPYEESLPSIPDSDFRHEEKYCPTGTSPCMNNDNGIDLTTYGNIPFNACGNPISEEDNTCDTTTCVFYNPSPNGIPSCKKETKTYDYNNFSLYGELNSNKKCEQFNSLKGGLSFILCYITNVGNVETLNYQYFGANESSLTTQVDKMNYLLNNCSPNTLLPYYRGLILDSQDNTDNPELINAFSFTNFFEKNEKGSNVKNIIQDGILTCKNYVNNYSPSNSNKQLEPALWDIKINQNNMSCPIELSTSVLYKSTTVKYPDFNNNNNNTIPLSIYKGSQPLFLEHAKLIKDITPLNQPNQHFIALTTNIRTNNKLYLIPSSVSGFSNNSSTVKLEEHPDKNGKWLILGMKLKNITELNGVLKDLCIELSKKNEV